MYYLITGITGFVGPHLAKLLLDEGHDVYGLIRGSNGRETDLLDVLEEEDLKHIKFLYGDLTDYKSIDDIMRDCQFDGVFHLAAQSHPPTSFTHPIQTFQTNVMGTINLITAMEEWQEDCHFHFCSTSEVYGNTCKEGEKLTEDMKLTPSNPYGVSKAAMDMYVQERIQNGKLKGFITRAFSHTGPRRGHKFSISSDAYQLAKMLRRLQDTTLLVGNLETKRVVMDVRDCVRAYYMLMRMGAKGVYNVAGKDVHKMQYYTNLLVNSMVYPGDIKQKIHPPFYRTIDIDVQEADVCKLEKVTGWKCEIPIEQTMEDLLKYWWIKLGVEEQ